MDLGTFINKSGCECLNESDDHHLSAALAKGPDYMESDCDEQVHVHQNQTVYIFKIFSNIIIKKLCDRMQLEAYCESQTILLPVDN